jgi:hypothetical protein
MIKRVYLKVSFNKSCGVHYKQSLLDGSGKTGAFMPQLFVIAYLPEKMRH